MIKRGEPPRWKDSISASLQVKRMVSARATHTLLIKMPHQIHTLHYFLTIKLRNIKNYTVKLTMLSIRAGCGTVTMFRYAGIRLGITIVGGMLPVSVNENFKSMIRSL